MANIICGVVSAAVGRFLWEEKKMRCKMSKNGLKKRKALAICAAMTGIIWGSCGVAYADDPAPTLADLYGTTQKRVYRPYQKV